MEKRSIFHRRGLGAVEKNMKACHGLCHSFLGGDPRKLSRIVAEDRRAVKVLDLTHDLIAQRLRKLTEAARHGWGDPVKVDELFDVEVHESRGNIPCPWGHPGLYRKSHVKLINLKTGQGLVWSDLAIHMIEAHGFYQGRGSPYRLEPAEIKRILGL